jgi:hypothetical protein
MALGRKTGGRQKGTPNKDKGALLATIREKYPDYHPILAMAAVANDESVTPEMRFQAHKEIAPYIEPKRKATELTGADGEPLFEGVKLERGIAKEADS